MPSVLLTGASRGLGLEFARQYAADGWHVIGTCRDPAGATELQAICRQAAGRNDGKIEIHALDAGDFAAVAALAERLSGVALDVVIANAGIWGPRSMSAEQIDAPGWAETFRINTMAPLALAGAFRPHLERGTQRKALALSSALASIGGNSSGGLYAYRSSKAALNAAWRSFAVDHPQLIAAVLQPGWVRTDMGGPGAPLAPAQSIAGLRRVIAGLTPANSGGFYSHDGSTHEW
ncbi:MAG: Short-chain dehydrogenase/reductase [Rhodospirillales bacterium]|jgi:NAD(P)-dependent dehydrogenase (short-subunit alcohol dehydrogenase family)|nr:Short-chain dehydrogenase/reductase [Rhodospirillales bacterium]